MKALLVMVLYLIFSVAIIYGCWWIGKTISYKIFYEAMVQKEIHEMVKDSCLQ